MTAPTAPGPLATLQERFRLLAQIAPGTALGSAGLAVHVEHPLADDALELAVADLVARHGALRVQPAQPGAPEPVLETVSAASRPEALDVIRRNLESGFDPESGRAFRVLHVQLPAASLLLLAGHRIAVDHRSLRALATELAGRYDARRRGDGAPLPANQDAPPAAGGAEAAGMVLAALRGASPEIDLPLERPRPAVPTHQAGRVSTRLPATTVERAESFARAEGVDERAVYVAAFQALLQRYGRQADVVVGAELDRRASDADTAVGPYADLALVGTGPEPPATFRGLVGATAERLHEAAAAPPVPPHEVAEALGLRLGIDLPSPCRVAFAVRPGRELVAPGWTAEPLTPSRSEFDLELVVATGDAGVDVELDYAADVLSRERAQSIADAYARLLASALDGPGRHRSLLDVVSAADRRLMLGAWNDFPDLAAVERPVHEVVERHAAERPDAPALTRADERLTYGELNRRANQLARVVRERVGPGEPVIAICMDRSSEWLVSVLASFKAGAVPVLLDPRAPRRRHELAVQDCRPQLALSLDRLGMDLPFDPARVVLLDRDWPEIDARPAGDLRVPIDLDRLAYLVQTSGSTGVPKSVGVPHRALTHCSAQQAAAYPIRPDDRSTWFAPPGASISIIEIWPYLYAGASLHIAEPDTVASPPALRDWLLGTGITQTFVIAPVAEILTSLDWPPSCALRLMTVAGEKVRTWAPAELPFEVAVTYGSAEATYISSCLHPWERRVTSATATPADRAAPPPIGRPWPGVRAYVVDGDLNLMPPGATGELAVDSPELARGYLHDPVRTALKFVPDPYGPVPGRRLYLTGDLASQRADGMLDHRGRVDGMVKVRGFRVEVAEVEAALLDHPQVTAAAVAARPDPRGEQRLVAYVVPDAPVTATELRGTVAQRLPEAMVPSAFVFLERLPLNTSAKVDRLALPPPDWDAVLDRAPYRAPRDGVERALVALWAEVLSVADAGIDDDFFALGGDSLRAGRLALAIRDRLGVALSLRDLFLARTPADLAARIRDRQEQAPPELPPVRRRT